MLPHLRPLQSIVSRLAELEACSFATMLIFSSSTFYSSTLPIFISIGLLLSLRAWAVGD